MLPGEVDMLRKVRVSDARARLLGKPRLGEDELEQIAHVADVDKRTVARVLAGLPTRPRPSRRIVAAIHDLGFARLLRRTG